MVKTLPLLLGAAIAGSSMASDLTARERLRARHAAREAVVRMHEREDKLAEEKMKEAWLSGDLEARVVSKKPKRTWEPKTYDIAGLDKRFNVVLRDQHGRERTVKRRDLHKVLLYSGMSEEERRFEMEAYYSQHFGQLVGINLERATDISYNPTWNKIESATSQLPAPYDAFLRSIAVQESLGGKYADITGGCVGIYQIHPETFADIQKEEPNLRPFSFRQIKGKQNVQLQTKAAYAYIRMLEEWTGATVEEFPGIIAAAYNAGPGILKVWDGKTPFARSSYDICTRENMRRVLRMGPVKAQITEEYGRAVTEMFEMFRSGSYTE